METADPPVRSFGKLAVTAKKDSDWPAETEVQERSLATLFSRLDRGQDLSWLADRSAVQMVLARALGVPLDPIRSALGERIRADAEPHLLRLRDIPSARALDLERDELPPGLPPALLSPNSEALWWCANSGSGRSLLGRWLAARGRATFIDEAAFSELVVPSGPCFLELSASSRRQPPPARPGVWVAASYLPPRSSGFRVVTSPPLLGILGPLLDWVRERLPRESNLEPGSALAFLTERLKAGELTTLGEALGLIGLIDELGLREVSKKSFDKVAQRFVEQRLARNIDPAMPFAGWLRRSLYPTLVGMAERSLVDSASTFGEAKTFETWLTLVPPELERNVDLEWMQISLSKIDTAIRPLDLERAARKLPPGAFRVVSSLETAGLLRRQGNESLLLGPAWVRAHLERKAIRAVLMRSPFEWGEALLQPHAAVDLAEALLERVLEEGGAPLEPVLDLESEDQPAYAAAVDLAFRVAGIARLMGADIGHELMFGLWQENATLLLELGAAAPLPRIELRPGAERMEQRRGDALLHTGSFYLAALSVSENLDAGPSARMQALDPWRRTEPGTALGSIYDMIADSLAEAPPWTAATYSLIQRVRTSVGNALGPDDPHRLELPAQVLDEVEHGVLAFESVQRLSTQLDDLAPLLALANERRVPERELARAVWSAWQQAERPEGVPFLAPDAPHHTLFWAHVPGALLENLLLDARRRQVPYAVFGDEQWDAYARALARAPELATDSAAWQTMPFDVVTRVLALPLDWAQSADSIAILWQRFPELLAAASQRELKAKGEADPDVLAALLGAAPDAFAAPLLDEVEQQAMTLSPAARPAVRLWLRRIIARRVPGYRDAYHALAALERSTKRL
jgi:hypothetical protein